MTVSSGVVTSVENMFDRSVLVVAHPDDEALWYSSILSRVGTIIICFLESTDHPEWNAGRHSVLSNFPFENAYTLGLTEARVFNRGDWFNPRVGEYGMEIAGSDSVRQAYIANHDELYSRLEERLKGSSNVFTHNPWGEYGHEEHVQVYSVVKKLQGELGFDIWCSNYCSNKSYNLMLDRAAALGTQYVTLQADERMGRQLKALYHSAGCWSWYDDYEWFDEETLLLDGKVVEGQKRTGKLFPVNFLTVEYEPRRKAASRHGAAYGVWLLKRLIRRLAKRGGSGGG